ncbi:MAG TPA: GMC family oxidoreductase [Gemmataceae bacterium]|nr:GMC family oxidoreductase [Gemmataceae bacterium]
MSAEYDFIVVGSGAGGGPLACNLALAPEGYRVALLEAGGDPALRPQSYHYYNYSIPGLHAHASEDPGMSWSFFVQHYGDPKRQSKEYDCKYQKDRGIFYPRAAAIGGCTAHHAMITVYPHNDDWRNLQSLTGDPSWAPEQMRQYFERLEDCQYLPRTGNQAEDPATRHGFAGWLPVSMADPTLALGDEQLLKLLVKSFLFAQVALHQPANLGMLLDDKARTDPANKQRITGVLTRAAGHLLDSARQAAQRFPDSLGAVFTRLQTQFSQLAGRIAASQDIFQAFAEDPSLLELFRVVHAQLDPNRWFDNDASRTGVYSTPASIADGTRSAVRERILAVQSLFPDRLVVMPYALATEVIIDKGRAAGVRYLEGSYLYHASPQADPKGALPPLQEVRLRDRGEVILAGGAFNTPQLLMLSGVGPAADLTKLGVAVQCDLPGVGQNLQDRYEIGVVSELEKDFKVLEGSKFEASDGNDPNDRGLQEWLKHRGVYASNGVVLTIIKKSAQAERDIPDLFLFGVPGFFKGYYPGYSQDTQNETINGTRQVNHRRFTWAILKGSTRNRNGVVKLASKDPRVPPDINFKYFDEGTGAWEKDLKALMEGVRFAAQLVQATGLKHKILAPPPSVNIDDDQQLGDFIRQEAWGHHACGTCKIGKDQDAKAVLDGDFRVRGVENLRVVDASAVPDIPGFFIVTSIYMMSEKASDVILADHRRPAARAWPRPPTSV